MKSFGAAVIVLVLALTATATPARAADRITITNYGINITTLPWAVALERGLFQREGVDIDGFVGSSGGGSAIRNMMASKIPFAEVSVPAAVAALQNGIELKIVYGALYHLGELSWMVRKDSTIKSIADLRGRKVAYTSPQSVTEMVVRMVLDAHHITSDVALIPAGSIEAAHVALDQGAVDAARALAVFVDEHVKREHHLAVSRMSRGAPRIARGGLRTGGCLQFGLGGFQGLPLSVRLDAGVERFCAFWMAEVEAA